MKLDLIEKVFGDTETLYTLNEAMDIAKTIFRSAMENDPADGDWSELEDYWIQIGKEWDLNIYFWESQYHADIYPVCKINGHIDTDTNNCYPIDI